MLFLRELIQQNGHKLVRYNEAIAGHIYMSVFNYSENMVEHSIVLSIITITLLI